MKELIFKTAQDYLAYDFDDNFCFFYEELKKYGEYHPTEAALVDYEGKFAEIIRDLYKIYDALIIQPEEELLLGLIGNTRVLIRKSPIKE